MIKNVLFIGAHYDDVDLGAGGTAARLAAEGCKVYKLTLTDNLVEESVFSKYTAIDSSKRESQKACKILGIMEVTEFEAERNCHLMYSTELMQRVEAIIVKYNIDTVFIHSEYDMNHDHVEAAKVCKIAARHVNNIYVHRANIYVTETQFAPRVYWDISNYVELKKQALGAYGEEHQRIMADGQNRLFEDVIHQNKIWGYAINTMYAEGFEVIKEVR